MPTCPSISVLSLLCLSFLIRVEAHRPRLAIASLKPTHFTVISGIEFNTSLELNEFVPETTLSVYVHGEVVHEVLMQSHRAMIPLRLPNGRSNVHVLLRTPDDKKGISTSLDFFGIPGVLGLIPPLLTMVCSIVTRHVLLSLFLGVWIGATIGARYNPVVGLLRSMDLFIPNAMADYNHAVVLIFCLMLSGMIVVVSKSGGAAGFGEFVISRASSSFSGQFATWLFGCCLFIDDYFNTLVVGNTVRPIADRLRISREKLAFLIDGTAAPIASIAPISSWVGFEISLIKDELIKIGLDKNEYVVFLKTIPLRYYSIFLIVFCVTIIVSRRDFGPMLECERRARKAECHPESEDDGSIRTEENPDASNPLFEPLPGVPHRWYNGAIPVLTLIVMTFLGMIVDGVCTISENQGVYSIDNIFASAESFRVLMWSAFLSLFVPIGMYWAQGIMKPSVTVHWFIEGMKELMEPFWILILAWSLGEVVEHLQLASWLIASLQNSMPAMCLPTVVFVMSGFIAFCTGSSWSTMSILMPIVIPLTWSVGKQNYDLLVQSIASVLAGSVFGDHCSPISDTTVLVCVATKCSIPDHVRTQIPYALLVASVSILVGTLPTAASSVYSQWIAIPVGSLVLVVTVFVLGTRVEMYQDTTTRIEHDKFLSAVTP